jgi:aspartate/methionine/tyrosine aminotransferase
MKTFKLWEKDGEWLPDLRGLRKAVSKKAKLIAICNPNNPTGAVLHEEVVEEICALAKKANGSAAGSKPPKFHQKLNRLRMELIQRIQWEM